MMNELTMQTNLTIWEDQDKLKEIKKIFAPKLNQNEFEAFIGLGKATELNPFLREIWAVKYAENSAAQIFIGRDGYRKSAQRNPNYDYHQADAVYSNDTFEMVNGEVRHSYKLTNRGDLIGGYCVVKRRSSSKPMYVYVNLKDYDKKQSCWNSIKATMIAKVAEAQCLRMAFQEQFAGSLSEYEEPMVIEGTWQPKQSQTDKMNLLLAKKGMNHDQETNHNASNTSDASHDLGLCNSYSNPAPHASETDACPGLAENGASKDIDTVTQNVPTKCSTEQLDIIDCSMHDKGFDDARKIKALRYFGVDTFAQLSIEQADEMIKTIAKAE